MNRHLRFLRRQTSSLPTSTGKRASLPTPRVVPPFTFPLSPEPFPRKAAPRLSPPPRKTPSFIFSGSFSNSAGDPPPKRRGLLKVQESRQKGTLLRKISLRIVQNGRQQRLTRNLTQEDLASRSGLPLGNLRHFSDLESQLVMLLARKAEGGRGAREFACGTFSDNGPRNPAKTGEYLFGKRISLKWLKIWCARQELNLRPSDS